LFLVNGDFMKYNNDPFDGRNQSQISNKQQLGGGMNIYSSNIKNSTFN